MCDMLSWIRKQENLIMLRENTKINMIINAAWTIRHIKTHENNANIEFTQLFIMSIGGMVA